MFGLSKPESFDGDPYGYLTNQISHLYLGVFLTTAYCWIVNTFWQYPNQTIAVSVVVFGYFVWWEIIRQGWRGLDTLEDTFFVFGGASFFLVIEIDWVIDRMFTLMALMWVPLVLGAFVRSKNGKRD